MGQKSRINKYIALCGICSRRAAEKLISEKRVSVNGEILQELGRTIDHDLDSVEVDGSEIRPEKIKEYILLNKPGLALSTVTDPHGRPTVMQLLEKVPAGERTPGRVYPVGRLDFDTEGVLLLTNDGGLAHRLTHPRYEIRKVYQALVEGEFTPACARKIAGGVELEDGHKGHAETRKIGSDGKNSVVEIVLTEGHKHEVKQLLAACDLPTLHLRRVSFAGLRVEELKSGKWRRLKKAEISALRRQVGL